MRKIICENEIENVNFKLSSNDDKKSTNSYMLNT